MKKLLGQGWGTLRDHPLYIFFFSLYPILFLYHQNIREVAFGDTLVPMLLSLAVTLVLWLGSAFFYRARGKRALAVLAVQLLLFYYKLVSDLLAETLGFSGKPLSRPLSALFVFSVLFFLLFLIRRSTHGFVIAGRALNVIMLSLLALNVSGILFHHLAKVELRRARSFLKQAKTDEPSSAALKPDIYCFILDEFASLETIRDIFHYDNSSFAQRLQAAGFFVASRSRGLYTWTPDAIAALLNMGPVPEKADPAVLIRHNRVSRFLKERGYRVYDFPLKNLSELADAERHFDYPQENVSILFNDFYKTLVDMSVFYAWAEKWQNSEEKYSRFFRERVLYVFAQLPAVVKMKGPKFVLVHLPCPHAPFVFDRDGGALAARYSIDYSDRSYYLGQYLFISRRIAATLEMILRESASPPVIVAVSDHGYRGSFRKPLLHVVDEAEKKKIFLSLYLPGYAHERLDAALSPQHVFRIILQHYFGQGLTPVPSAPE